MPPELTRLFDCMLAPLLFFSSIKIFSLKFAEISKPMNRKITRIFFFVGLVLTLSSWGFLVHRTVNQLAIYALPKKLDQFFFRHKDYLVENAPRPDTRRNTDSTEGNKHFMDMEYYGENPFRTVPHVWTDAVKKYSVDTLKKYGTLPYTVIATQEKLTRAFRNRDADSILYYAADIGHYISDAHVPLHTSMNYDGQLTNQRGIHDLWETTVPELKLYQFTIRSRHKAMYLHSPQEAIWQILEHTHSLLPGMLAAEKEVSKHFTDSTKYRWQVRWGRNRRFYSQAFAAEYYKVIGPSINTQLIASANAIADFWYTAWVDAGRPDLNQAKADRKDKKQFKRERRAYRKNHLVAKKWLISLQSAPGDQ